MADNTNRQIFSHTVEGLGTLSTLEKSYNKINAAQLKLVESSGALGNSLKQEAQFKGYDKYGRKVATTVKQLDLAVADITTKFESQKGALVASTKTFKEYDAQGNKVTRTIRKLGDEVRNTSTTVDSLGKALTKVRTVRELDAQGNKLTRTTRELNGNIVSVNESLDKTGKQVRTTDTIKSLDAAGNKLTKTSQYLNGQLVAVNTTTDAIPRKMKPAAASIDKTEKSAKQFGITWNGVSRIIVGSLVSRAVAEVTNSIRQSIETAQNFVFQIGELRTISQEAQLSTDAWSNSLLNLSNAFGTPILDVTEGAYQTLSNQIAKGTEVTTFLTEAQRLAVIGVSSTEDAVLALTGVLNSYNLGASEARNVSNSLFKTIELGRLRLSDVAESIGRVTILGSQLNLTYNEINAALATLTIQGISAAEGMTFLRGVLQKLIRPTDKMNAFFDTLGVTSGEAAIATFGFGGVLQKIADTAGTSADPLEEIGSLFGRLRATIGAVGLIRAMERYDSNLEKLVDSAQSADEAFKLMRESIGFKFRKELNELSNFFTVKIGKNMVESLVNLSDEIGGFAKRVEQAFELLKTATVAAAFVGFGKLIAAGNALNTTFAANIFLARQTALGVTQLSLSAKAAALSVGTLNYALTTTRALLASVAFQAAAAAAAGYAIGDALSRTTKTVDLLNGTLSQDFLDQSNLRIQIYKEEMDSLVKNSSSGIDKTIQKYKQLQAAVTAAVDKILALEEEQKELSEKIFETEFDLLKNKGDNKSALDLAESRVADILTQVDKLKAKGGILGMSKEDRAAAVKLLEEAESLASKIGSLESKEPKKSTKKSTKAVTSNDRFRVPAGRFGGTRIGADGRPELIIGNDGASTKRNAFVDAKKEEIKLSEKLLGLLKDIQKASLAEGDASKIPDSLVANGEKVKEAIEDLEGVSAKIKQVGTDIVSKKEDIQNFLNEISKIGGQIEEQLGSVTGKGVGFFGQIGAFSARNNPVAQEVIKYLNDLKTAGVDNDIDKTAEALHNLFTVIQQAPNLTTKFTNQSISFADFFKIDEAQLNNIRIILEAQRSLLIDIEKLDLQKDKQEEFLKGSAKTLGVLLNSSDTQKQADAIIQSLTAIQQNISDTQKAELNSIEAVDSANKWLLDSTANYALQAKALVDRILSLANQAEAATRAIARPVSNIPAEQFVPPNNYFGKFITRAAGGSIGRDSQMALLDPREFVMNASKSAKFLPQLMAMNSGSRRFESGGQVTNNNIGDINMTISNQNGGKINARQLANELRRELSRNTARLN